MLMVIMIHYECYEMLYSAPIAVDWNTDQCGVPPNRGLSHSHLYNCSYHGGPNSQTKGNKEWGNEFLNQPLSKACGHSKYVGLGRSCRTLAAGDWRPGLHRAGAARCGQRDPCPHVAPWMTERRPACFLSAGLDFPGVPCPTMVAHRTLTW